jgi:cysteine synthase A
MGSMKQRADEIAVETGAFATNQFGNPDVLAGYRTLADELLTQMPVIHAFCSFVGTAGCFVGTTRGLVREVPDLWRVVVEPAESAVLSGGPAGAHHIEGGGFGYRPPLLGPDDYDEVVAVSETEAFTMARQAARLEGIFSGPSTGANLVAAVRLARTLGPDRRVVTVQVDSGLKYLTSTLYA